MLHIILSHHGKLEHGSPVTPCTREATLVHMIDNLGGRLGSFDRLEKALADGESWSGFDRALSGSAYFGAARRESRLEPANSGVVARTAASRAYAEPFMAKDTEKLIRQLSLISFLMAERRPVTALEIKQEVEGYAQMNDDAFARRFYADRAELDSLGHRAQGREAGEGSYEAETYTLPPENFYLPAIEFTDEELGAAAHRAQPARRRVRLRRAAAARAAAALVGQAVAARGARAADGEARR